MSQPAPRALTAVEARRLRHRAHLLAGSGLGPVEVARRMVALQGQDLRAVLAAIALRSRPGTTLGDVRAAFDAGELVRSWPMRGTLFATTPTALAVLLAATGERTHRATARRRAQLGLDDATVARAGDLLADALAERPLTRAAALEVWERAGISTTGGRGYHLLMHHSVAGLAHWGAFAGDEQLLTLTTTPPPADPEAALVGLLRDVVATRGPVTEADLAWWTKLPTTRVRRLLASADATPVSVEGTAAWVVGEPEVPGPSEVTLVPAFDEWILAYADRSLVATPEVLRAIVPGGNGVFRPVVLVDGVAVGTWRIPRSGTGPVVDLVEQVTPATRRAVEAAVDAWPHRG